MPRGAKKDIAITKLAHEQGWLIHSKSFVSLDGHLFLHRSDKSYQRVLIFRRYKTCAVCGLPAIEHGEPGFASEWHHKSNCDCIGCAEVRCGQLLRDCHRHRTPGFKRDMQLNSKG